MYQNSSVIRPQGFLANPVEENIGIRSQLAQQALYQPQSQQAVYQQVEPQLAQQAVYQPQSQQAVYQQVEPQLAQQAMYTPQSQQAVYQPQQQMPVHHPVQMPKTVVYSQQYAQPASQVIMQEAPQPVVVQQGPIPEPPTRQDNYYNDEIEEKGIMDKIFG